MPLGDKTSLCSPDGSTILDEGLEVVIVSTVVFSRPYLSNGRAIDMIVVRVHPFLCPSVTDVLWLNFRSKRKTFYMNN